MGNVDLVARPRDCTSALAQYTVVLEQRERVQGLLQAAGIPTAVHYPVPMHMQPAYARWCGPDAAPVARSMAARVLSLPIGPYLDDASIVHVASTLLQALGRQAGPAPSANPAALTEPA